jgi:hypothetical protein
MMGVPGVDPKHSSVKHWQIERAKGGCYAAGVGGSIVGFGADLLVIDDYLKDAKSSFSQKVRDDQWDWFVSTSGTRLEPGGKCVLLCCLTGDSIISMADGTERMIKDILPGDSVKSFDAGHCVNSNVVNHARVGRDNVFRVTLESGKSIVGNARHPFLVEENGELKWVRLKHLTTSMKIVTYKKSSLNVVSKNARRQGTQWERAGTITTKQGGKALRSSPTITENGRIKLVNGKVAKSQLNVRVFVQVTIQKTESLKENSREAEHLISCEIPTCGIGIGSELKSMKGCSRSKTEGVLFVERYEPKRTATVEKTFALTTATRPEKSGVCYVFSATSQQDTLKPVPPPLDSLNTSEFTSESIVAIEPDGFEDVYDIEVESTGSFIANGMVTHNTQWNSDDLIGRIEKRKDELDIRVRSITLQALREGTEVKDPLGRAEGEALWPERWPAEVMERRKRQAGHWWHSIYQGNPKGSSMANWPESYFSNVFADDVDFPEPTDCLISASFLDPSKGKNSRKGDYQAQIWIGYKNGLFWIDSDIDRKPIPKMVRDFVLFNRERKTAFVGLEANAWQDLLADDYWDVCREIEYNADRPELVNQTTNKTVRIERLGKWLNQRLLRFRKSASNELLIKQMQEFPYGQYDDGPDALEACIALLCRSVDALHGLHEVTETEA